LSSGSYFIALTLLLEGHSRRCFGERIPVFKRVLRAVDAAKSPLELRLARVVIVRICLTRRPSEPFRQRWTSRFKWTRSPFAAFLRTFDFIS